MENKTQLHKPSLKEVAVALIGIAMAILLFVRVPRAFIVGIIFVMVLVTYLLACMGFFNDETEMGNE